MLGVAAVETPDVTNLTQEQIEALSPAEQLMVAVILVQLEEQGVDVGQLGISKIQGPQNKEELWQAVYDLTGYRIPRKAVCKGHHAPLDMFWEAYSGEVEDALWIGNRGGGKRLALDTKVPTPDGWTTIGEIKKGDQLFDETGAVYTVLKAHSIESEPDAYKVVFSDGEEIEADAEHLWYTEARLPRGGRKRHARRHPGVRTTVQIRDSLTTYQAGEWNHSIPNARALQLPDVDLPLDPYVFGAWLGDGASTGGLLHTNDEEVEFFIAQLEAAGHTCVVTAHRGGTNSEHSRQVRFGQQTTLKELGVYGNKHIPIRYLRASEEQRLALLQGLMDTDGSVSREGKAEYITGSQTLRDGVGELLRSLGFKGIWTEKTVRPCASSNAPGDSYGPYYRFRIQAYADRPIVRMPHKLARLRNRPTTQPISEGRRIVAVEPIDPKPMRCLTVDSPSGLFLVGAGMVPTHNTTLSGFLHGAKCRYHADYESTIAGAMKLQSKRAYAEFQRFVAKLAEEILGEPMASETNWGNGSKTEVIGGTLKQLNGPHPHFAQFDEVELTTIVELEEFENMAQGDVKYAAQTLLTSSRKKASGLVQALVNEIKEAIAAGNEPPRELRIFCVWETVQNVPNCMDGCGCDKIIKGHHQDGTERTFADMCAGKLKQSDGFVPLRDARKRFLKLSKRTWEAQQECKEVALEGIVHYWWDPDLYGLEKWLPKSEYGPVYRSWDWGGTNPHSVHWSQVLKFPVEWEGELIPEGVIITFDELYYSDKNIQGKKGFGALGNRVFERTQKWQKEWGFNFEVEYDFCDPAGAAAKSDVKEAARMGGFEIPRFKSVPAPVLESVEKHVEWGDDGLIRVVIPFCPMLVEGYEDYSWPERKPGQPPASKPIQVDDHAVDDDRYKVWNLYKLGKKDKRESEAPAAADHESQRDRMKREEKQERGHLGQGSPVGSSARNAGYVSHDPLESAEVPTVRKVTTGRHVR